jgi:hypothetical protein
VRENLWFGQVLIGGFTLHPLVLLFALSGSLMISRIAFRSFDFPVVATRFPRRGHASSGPTKPVALVLTMPGSSRVGCYKNDSC